jgi:HAD superfamily hydrolase (TIGR01509 family)
MIRAVVFDFDGILADSEPLHLRAYQEVFDGLGTTLTREEYYSRYLGYNDEDMFRHVAADRGWSMSDEQIAAVVAEKTRVFDAIIDTTDVLFAGAAACVERLAAAFPLGIASGALPHEIRTILKRANLDRHFRFIVGSGDTFRSKPAPDPYLRAAELHALPPSECVAIEDSKWGIESAQTAGMTCIGVTHTYPADRLAMADVVVASLDDITADLIRGFRRV